MSRSGKEVRQKGSVKRKREEATEENNRDADPPKKKPSQPQRPKQTEADESIAMMDPALLADHFAKTIRKQFPDSSAVELEDRYLPTKAFRDTTDFDQDHIAGNMADFLDKFTKGGKEELGKCDKNAGPHTLVITSSGIRTADIARELRVFNSPHSQVAKLIAKHMKLKDNVAHMKKNPVGIAISTPMRLRDLIDAGAIKIGDVRRIVVDGSYRDEKKRSIFDLDEIIQPSIELLNRDELRQRYGATIPIEILVF